MDADRRGHSSGVAAAGGAGGDEWEVLQHESGVSEEDEVGKAETIYVNIHFLVYIIK